jgi:hypothetical protein
MNFQKAWNILLFNLDTKEVSQALMAAFGAVILLAVAVISNTGIIAACAYIMTGGCAFVYISGILIPKFRKQVIYNYTQVTHLPAEIDLCIYGVLILCSILLGSWILSILWGIVTLIEFYVRYQAFQRPGQTNITLWFQK